jgi:hypothetical protein
MEPLEEAAPERLAQAEIEAVRAQARREKGWIMDTYLLRKGAQK